MVAIIQGRAPQTGRHEIERDFKATLERILPFDAEVLEEDFDPLAPPVDDEAWEVPGVVEVDGENLVWRWERCRMVRSGRGMLEDFLALGEFPEAPDRCIQDYAQRWGVLRLCAEHERPVVHNRPSVYDITRILVDGDLPPGSACVPRRHSSGGELVPLWSWRRYAHEMRTVLAAAALLRGDRVVPAAAALHLDLNKRLQLLFSNHDASTRPASTQEAHRAYIRVHVNEWLTDGHVGVAFIWSDHDQSALRLTGDGLFGALVAQLVVALRGAGGFAFCSACFHAYVPTRKPRQDQEHYCPQCRPDPSGRRAGSMARTHQKRRERERAKTRDGNATAGT